MQILKVKTKPSYEILIEEGLLEKIPADLKRHFDFGKVAIITDSKVESLYGEKLLNLFQSLAIKVSIFSFPEGEASKNMDTW